MKAFEDGLDEIKIAERCKRTMNFDPFITVLSGTAVASSAYILKQFMDYYFFDPVKEYHELRGKALEAAIFLSHFLENLPTAQDEETIRIWFQTNQEVRRIAGQVIAFQKKRNRCLFGLPSREKLRESAVALLGLARCTRTADKTSAKTFAKDVIKSFQTDEFRDLNAFSSERE